MYIVFINPQGNFDHNDSYWTMHPDFGGQLVYVKEIAMALSSLGHQVDIITRQFDDSRFPEFKEQFDYYDNTKNPRIVRIPCGPTSFLNKEDLWPLLEEWVTNIVHFFESNHQYPDFITGHYGDGGIASALLKSKIHRPYSLTGHSLGAQKLEKLGATKSTYESLDHKYHFTKRLLAERNAILNADLLFVSTKQERDEQYTHELYLDVAKDVFDRKAFVISPPGANTTTFTSNPSSLDPSIFSRLEKVLERDILPSRRDLPYLVLASRLDPKKNHLGVLRAYAEDTSLQEQVNIAISLRGIENAFVDFSSAKNDELEILTEMMQIIKESHLEGHISFLSINSQQELASFYRLSAKKKSIFVLTSLYEPFGLAPIEAMSSGLPAVVTKNGGPADVLYENEVAYGILVDPFDTVDIAKGIHKMLKNYEYYQQAGKKRVHDKYTWNATALAYINAMKNLGTTARINLDLSLEQENKLKKRILSFLPDKGV
ncbi:MAG: glycosyltransferase [Candidatus Izemoplasmatales bacterium]